jgi:hypothetical protein
MRAILFICLLGTCVPALASAAAAEPLITRSTVEDNRISLMLANLEQQRVHVTLTDLRNDRELLHRHVSKHNGYRTQLNLDQLDNGRYVITVEKGKTVRRQVILKTDEGLMCSAWK